MHIHNLTKEAFMSTTIGMENTTYRDSECEKSNMYMGCSGGTTNSRHTTRASYPENFGTVTIEPNLPHGNNKIRN